MSSLIEDLVNKVVEACNQVPSEEMLGEYAAWKEETKPRLLKEIKGKTKKEKVEILFREYVETVEFNQTKEITDLLDNEIFFAASIHSGMLSTILNANKSGRKSNAETMIDFWAHNDIMLATNKNNGFLIDNLIRSRLPILSDIHCMIFLEDGVKNILAWHGDNHE